MKNFDPKEYAKSFHSERFGNLQNKEAEAKITYKNRLAEIRKKSPPEKHGYVYYAGDGHGRVKIGYSKNPWARIKEMRSHNPTIEVLATEKCHDAETLEKLRQSQFCVDHLALEWFRLSVDIQHHIDSLNSRSPSEREELIVNVALPRP